MTSMKAAQFGRYGGPDVLEIATTSRPRPGPNQVLVAVEASAVNPHDAVVRSGGLRLITGRRFPLGLGLDFAGTIAATGSEVHAMPLGTRVWGMVSPQSRHATGAAAQFVAVDTHRIGALPPRLSTIEAASLVTSGSTALRALRHVVDVQRGQRVLVRGGAGGVGMAAVQIACALGAHVTALVGARDYDYARHLGAHETLDYRTVTADQLQPFAAIIDTVGTDLLSYRRRLIPDGRMVTIAFGSAAAMTSIAFSTVFGPRRIRSFSSYPDRVLLDELAGFVDSAALQPQIDCVYPLEQIAEAHRALQRRARPGKLVLTMGDTVHHHAPGNQP